MHKRMLLLAAISLSSVPALRAADTAAAVTAPPVLPLASGAGLPVFHQQGVVLDYQRLKYNPCNDIIIPSVIRTGALQQS
jgi:hypothetical protein